MERPRPAKPTLNIGRQKPKTKSGCRTCKIRRVKCDGERPACHRCLSTGRACDGYGIWGGGSGGQATVTTITNSRLDLQPRSLGSTTGLADRTEFDCFDWFLNRTATKVPGLFESTFWKSIVLQAAHSEPAVRHAALALSSVHRIPTNRRPILIEGNPDEKERFTLQQYSKAISHLQPHFIASDRASIRIALITCVLFTCVEFLRGHLRTGSKHLQHGMKVLASSPAGSITTDDEPIREALIRLSSTAMMTGNGVWVRRKDTSNRSMRVISPVIFQTMLQARQRFNDLLEDIIELSQYTNKHTGSGMPDQVLESQNAIRGDLEAWHKAFTASRVHLLAQGGTLGEMAYHSLSRNYTVASIMLQTCTQPTDTMQFDLYQEDFAYIISRSVLIHKVFKSSDFSHTPFAHRDDVPPFVADSSFVMPLYYTAYHCRDHWIRLKAIRLLNLATSLEGIWSSEYASQVAREVMRIEEGDFYRDLRLIDDGLTLDEPGSFSELKDLPPLPESNRVQGYRLVFPDSPLEFTFLTCIMKDGRVIERKYDPKSRSWRDK